MTPDVGNVTQGQGGQQSANNQVELLFSSKHQMWVGLEVRACLLHVCACTQGRSTSRPNSVSMGSWHSALCTFFFVLMKF